MKVEVGLSGGSEAIVSGGGLHVCLQVKPVVWQMTPQEARLVGNALIEAASVSGKPEQKVASIS